MRSGVGKAPLYSPAVVKGLLGDYGLRPDKAFGQNFLIDGNILAHIVAAAAITAGDTVLEIGPGMGVLTRELAKRAAAVVAVEIDRRLLPVLAATLGERRNVRVVHADGLAFDLKALPPSSLMVANLPYNVGTAMVVRALESGRFKRLVFLVQKEVAQRLVAEADSPHYGMLSLVAAHFGRVTVVRDVPPSAFLPMPEVTSSVVKVEVAASAQADPELFKLIGQAFKHRRKTLKKNLLMAGYTALPIDRALEALEVDPKARAETLSLAQFRSLRGWL